MIEIKIFINRIEEESANKVDNASIIECLQKLNKSDVFKTLLEWGVINLRAEHYKDAVIDQFVDQKMCNTIEEAIEFAKSSEHQTYVYVDGGCECLNSLDV